MTLAVVIGVGVDLWLYNSLIVDTFYRAPAQLAATIIGAADPVTTLDVIWSRGGAVASQLWNNGGVLSGDFGFYVAGAAVWVLMGLLCVYTMFLVALSSVALAVLLALGPLFIGLLLFEATRRFFEAWLAQLANYALISILTVLVAALLLQIVESYAQQTAARGAAILTVDALDMVLVAVLVFLLLRQVMPIAAALAGGIALSTFGLTSRFVSWGLRQGGAASRGALALAVRPGAPAAAVPARRRARQLGRRVSGRRACSHRRAAVTLRTRHGLARGRAALRLRHVKAAVHAVHLSPSTGRPAPRRRISAMSHEPLTAYFAEAASWDADRYLVGGAQRAACVDRGGRRLAVRADECAGARAAHAAEAR